MTKKISAETLLERPLPMLPFPVVDIETTGLDPRRHSIIEIGAVWAQPGREEFVFHAECRAWEGAEFDPEAERVHGCSREEIMARPVSEQEAVLKFLLWLGGPVTIAGMNPAGLDLPMLRAALGRCFRWLSHRTIDMHTCSIAVGLAEGVEIPDTGFATDDIYALLGWQAEPRPHKALTGAKMEAAAFAQLLRKELRK